MKKSRITKALYKATFIKDGKTHIIRDLTEADLEEVKKMADKIEIEKI